MKIFSWLEMSDKAAYHKKTFFQQKLESQSFHMNEKS